MFHRFDPETASTVVEIQEALVAVEDKGDGDVAKGLIENVSSSTLKVNLAGLDVRSQQLAHFRILDPVIGENCGAQGKAKLEDKGGW